jgi:very-short-patch-repair endonuclease
MKPPKERKRRTTPRRKRKVSKKTGYAREHRKKPTPAERRIWQATRNFKMGFKVYREYVIEPFIVDFFVEPLSLAIELDGGYHNTQRQHDYDVWRDRFIKNTGVDVVRVWNEDATPERIKQIIDERAAAMGIVGRPLPLPPLKWPLMLPDSPAPDQSPEPAPCTSRPRRRRRP